MGLFFRKDTPVITDVANWPGMEATNQEMLLAAHSEMLRDAMPAEWYPQRAVQITWPDKETDWAPYLEEVEACYLRMAYEISCTERLIISCRNKEAVGRLLDEKLPNKCIENITLFECPINDTWVRDYGFLTVVEDGRYRLLDFCFNGWGSKFEASNDNAVNRRLFEAALLRGEYQDELHFVFEGGSIESDGQGTLMTTSQCLLNPNRNPNLSRGDIEAYLLRTLKSRRILWVDHGYLSGDDTDSHIDTLCRLCPNNTIVYVSCDDEKDEHYTELRKMEEQLKTFETLKGQPYRLLALPMGPTIYDEDGERLPSTYANYLVINGRVLMPTYGDEERDLLAQQVLERAFPGLSVTGIDCRALIKQHGSLHCSTMQYY